MKTPLIFCLFALIGPVALAQTPDKILAKASYTFSHIRDTTQKDKPYTENMALLIGRNASVYTSYDKVAQDLERRKMIEEQVKNAAPGQPMSINLGKVKPASAIEYYSFIKENKLFIKEPLITLYLTEEALPKIDWKTTKDTASFSGLHCQKATAHFKGRNWIAWYAPELPFQSGPWKLNGLPGLIVQAYDDKKEVQFLFAGFENVKNQPEPAPALPNEGTLKIPVSALLSNEIKLPADAVKTTVEALNKLKEARAKDPVGFAKAQMGDSGLTVVAGASRTGSAAPKNMLNNPIELPEKN